MRFRQSLVLSIAVLALLVFIDNSPANPHYIRQVQVQANIPVFAIGVPVQSLDLDYYYSVGFEFQKEDIIDEVIRRINIQVEEGDELKRSDFQFVAAQTSSEDTNARVHRVFQNNCIQCHRPGAEKPGVKLFNTDGSLFIGKNGKERDRRKKVYENVLSGAMPKGKPPLTADEKTIVRQWALEL